MSTFLGAVLGLLTSFLVALYFEFKQRKTDYIQIKKHFQFNLDRMKQIVSQLNGDNLPDYKLDLTVLDFLISHGPKSFKDSKQFEQFDHVRYQMHHINNELAFLFALSPPINTYQTKVVAHIQGEIKTLTDLLNKA